MKFTTCFELYSQTTRLSDFDAAEATPITVFSQNTFAHSHAA